MKRLYILRRRKVSRIIAGGCCGSTGNCYCSSSSLCQYATTYYHNS